MLTGAIGLVLVAFGEGVPWISDGFGNAMALAAAATSWTAARLFVTRPPRLRMAVAGPAIWLATMPLQTGAAGWTAMACLIGAAYTLATASELWQARAEHLPSCTAAVCLLGIHAAVYAARAVGALAGAGPSRWGASIMVGLTLESLLQTVGMAFLLLAMMKERVELRSSKQLRALTLLDGLTGISNRRHFDEQLDVEIRRARRAGTSVALLLIDVDHFKSFNDAFGHQQGDQCLRAIAKAIGALVCRSGDLAARYGGEEFAVLLPETDLAGATELADALRIAVRALGLEHTSGSSVVTISIGAAALLPRQQDASGDVLVQAADRALYQAKAAGRDRVCSAPGATPAGK
ncbi:MAG: diguanylate cyclase [Janthinobacterium lividum]